VALESGLGIAIAFNGVADRLEGGLIAKRPDLAALVARAEVASAAEPHSDPLLAAQLQARLALYRRLVAAIHPLVQDALTLEPISTRRGERVTVPPTDLANA
jgi:hypothetical protein